MQKATGCEKEGKNFRRNWKPGPKQETRDQPQLLKLVESPFMYEKKKKKYLKMCMDRK